MTGGQRRRLLFISAPQPTPPPPLQSPKGQRLIAGDQPKDKRGPEGPERSALINSDGRDRFFRRAQRMLFSVETPLKGSLTHRPARHAFTLATVSGEAAAPEGAEEETEERMRVPGGQAS